MKPFPDLPPRVLLFLAGILGLVLVGVLLRPLLATVLLVSAVALAVVGGWDVTDVRRWRGGLPNQGGAGGVGIRAAAVGAAVTAVAAALAAPGLFVKDAGELASGALTLGVTHPTGFAFFCMLGRAMGLAPLGDAFFRMNLLSAVSLGATAAAAWVLSRELASRPGDEAPSIPPLAALVAPAALLASPTAWLHGTTTEVYALSAAGMTASIACLLAGARRQDARFLVLGAFLAGLGAGGHVTWMAHAGGTLALVATVAVVRRPSRWRVLPAIALAAVLGATVVLYLPTAASRHPVMDWGDPSSAAAVLDHLTGARIRRSFAGQIGAMGVDALLANLRMAFGTLAEGTLALWPAAVVGLAWALVRDPLSGVVLLGVLAGDLAFAARINPMGIRDLQVLVPATVVIGILSAIGVAALARVAARRSGAPAAIAVVLAGLGLAVAQAVSAPSDRDMTNVQAPREVVSAFLQGLPPGTTVLTASDDLSAMTAAVQAVEGARPDVMCLVKQHLSDPAYVRRVLVAHGGRPGEERLEDAIRTFPFESAGEGPADALVRAVEAALARGPVRVETGEGKVDGAVAGRLDPGFPACSLEEVDATRAVDDARAAARSAAGMAVAADRWTRAFLSAQVRGLAVLAIRRGGEEAGRDLMGVAVRLNPRDPRALNNLGVLLADAGAREEALGLLRRAVEEDPSYVRGWRSLSRVAGEAGLAGESERAASMADRLGQ